MRAGTLDRTITFQRPSAGQEGKFGTTAGPWVDVATVRANVQDMLPSRAERISDQIVIASRPARVRIRYRTGLDSSMRILHGDRIMQIIAGPAEIGRREALEFIAQDYSTAGGAG